jgi:hypothetical protein
MPKFNNTDIFCSSMWITIEMSKDCKKQRYKAELYHNVEVDSCIGGDRILPAVDFCWEVKNVMAFRQRMGNG